MIRTGIPPRDWPWTYFPMCICMCVSAATLLGFWFGAVLSFLFVILCALAKSLVFTAVCVHKRTFCLSF